jgi:hypothetical protein
LIDPLSIHRIEHQEILFHTGLMLNGQELMRNSERKILHRIEEARVQRNRAGLPKNASAANVHRGRHPLKSLEDRLAPQDEILFFARRPGFIGEPELTPSSIS